MRAIICRVSGNRTGAHFIGFLDRRIGSEASLEECGHVLWLDEQLVRLAWYALLSEEVVTKVIQVAEGVELFML